jgi:Spy/CpxP family protein refolding chaperone
LGKGQKEELKRGGRKMKKIATLAGIMALVVGLAVPALAQGPWSGRGPYAQGGPGYCPYHGGAYGGWAGNLTNEQREQLDGLYQKFFDQTAQVRSQLWAKQSELNVQLNTSKPDAEKAKALQKEISDLQAKMAEERINLVLEARKISPEAGYGRGWGYGRGFGPMRGGYGPGMGYGRGMGGGWYRTGYGPGSCWY